MIKNIYKTILMITVSMLMVLTINGCSKKEEPIDVKDSNGNIAVNEKIDDALTDNKENTETETTVTDIVFEDDNAIVYKGVRLSYNPEDYLNLFSEEELLNNFSYDEIGQFFKAYAAGKGYDKFTYTVEPMAIPEGCFSINVNLDENWPCDLYYFLLYGTIAVVYDTDKVEPKLIMSCPLK